MNGAFRAMFRAMLTVLFALLLHQRDLETNKNGGIGFAVSSVHLCGCCCLEPFRGKKNYWKYLLCCFQPVEGHGSFFSC